MDKEYMSNYEKQCEQWRQKFLTMDQEEICRRLPEIEQREDVLVLEHFGRALAVDRKTGDIRALSDDGPVYVMTKFNVYTLFWYVKAQARLTGEWLPYRELKGGSPFGPAFQKGVLEPLAATFSGHEDLLEKAVEQMKGERLSSSGYMFHAFQCIPVRLNFWDGDEEFPAQANLLFDSSAVDFNHVESIATIAVECMYRLADGAGLEVRGNPLLRF